MNPSPRLPADVIWLCHVDLAPALNLAVLDGDAVLFQVIQEVPERNVTVSSSCG